MMCSIKPASNFEAAKYTVFSQSKLDAGAVLIYQFNEQYGTEGGVGLREGEYVYELVGQVKKVEVETETEEYEPLGVGYKFGNDLDWQFEILAVVDHRAWCRATKGAATEYVTKLMSFIPRRKVTVKETKLQILPI